MTRRRRPIPLRVQAVFRVPDGQDVSGVKRLLKRLGRNYGVPCEAAWQVESDPPARDNADPKPRAHAKGGDGVDPSPIGDAGGEHG